MKKLLLDTHTFLWWVENSPQLSDNALNIIQDIENECFLSLVSSLEMSIKAGIGKLKLTCSVQEYVPQHLAANQFRQLDISFSHVTGVESLEFHHRDPFDRLLAAQALEDNLILVSADRIFDRYGVERVW